MSWSDGHGQRVLILSAVHNNAATIGELQQRLAATACDAELDARFLYVDDGSTDRSWSLIAELVAADPRVAGIRFSGNFGQTRALCAGMRAARAEVVLYIDADLEIPPEAIGSLVPAITAGHDFVGGDRSTDSGRAPLRRLGARVFNSLTRALTGLEVRDVGCGLVAMRTNVVDAVIDELQRRPVQIIKPAMISAALDPVEVPISCHPPRDSAYSNVELMRFAAEFLALRAAAPLTILAGVGAAVCAAPRPHRIVRVLAGLISAAAVCLLSARMFVRRSAGELYEVDERIGWVAEPGAATLPRS